MKSTYTLLASALVTAFSLSGNAQAAVSAEEAAKLKTTLTPLGAERAGNKEGTIPAWDGKAPKPAAKTSLGQSGDPFADEKPVLQINQQNYQQYADKLSEGVIALIKKYPSFKVNVYPTHRTGGVVPEYIYDNTFKNATRAKLTHGGNGVEGAYGGVPFPLAKTGSEIIWNHMLKPRVESSEFGFKNILGSADGRYTVANRADNTNQSPYYLKSGSLEKWSGDYLLARFANTDPPFKAGEALVIRDNVDPANSRQAWQYLVGQRRVRRAPTVAYDTPDFVASGANYFDEVIGFYGSPDRFEWKVVGKKEIYVPYNSNKFFATPEKEAFVANHPNPDKARWELHRQWVVEATVAPGKRHVAPKRRFYFDEDTWGVSMIDGYDADGKLWRVSTVFPVVVPEYPMVLSDITFVYNLDAGTYSCIQCSNGEYWRSVSPKPESYFTGDALSSGGLR
jgi:hypothetical protein